MSGASVIKTGRNIGLALGLFQRRKENEGRRKLLDSFDAFLQETSKDGVENVNVIVQCARTVIR